MLSVPMILAMVMESFFTVVDAFFVSRVSINAIVTIGITESVIFLVYAITIRLAMAQATPELQQSSIFTYTGCCNYHWLMYSQ